MKKLLFLLLLMPALVFGQDSIRIRKILEKSIQAMDLKCHSIVYKLEYITSQTTEKGIEYITAKTTFDSTYSMQKLFIEWIKDTENQADRWFRIDFLDQARDTSFRFFSHNDLLKVGKYDDLKDKSILSYWNNNYFAYFQSMLIGLNQREIIFDRKDTAYFLNPSTHITFLKDSSLSYKGIAHINNIPCHVIEHITINPSNFTVFGYRYPDYKPGYYNANLQYNYYYIDTLSSIVQKSVFFGVTGKQDTVRFHETTLQSYAIDSIRDINFNPQEYPIKKVLRFDSESTCSKDWIVQELKGKAPDITGTDTTETPFSLYKQKAQCYVLDFMFAACGVCIAEALPFWEKMKEKYDHPDILYLIVDPIDKMESIKRMITEYNITIPVIQDFKAQRNYSVQSFPSYYILDKDFNVIFYGFGAVTDCDQKEIEKILSSYQQNEE